MKKFALTLFIAGTAISLSACDTTGSGYQDTSAPYSEARTAGGEEVAAPAAPVKAERVFKEYQSK